MKIGPKYKIARRLGSPIFEKTQTPQYALSLSRKEKNGKVPMRPKSEFGKQLIEKQKARFTYGISEKQFSKYVKNALSSNEPSQKLFRLLELRLDNTLYRSGLSKTRAQGRQIAAHGHVQINNKRVTIPSIFLFEGDVVSVRVGSKESRLFEAVEERMMTNTMPPWVTVDTAKKEATIVGGPTYVPNEHTFDLGAVIEFYSRS